jgi:hypothetical protein
VREDGIALEHHVHWPLVWGNARHILPVDQDRAFGGQLEPRDHPEQGGLAAPRRPQQDKELSGQNVEADIVDRRNLAEALGYVLDLDDRFLGRVGHGQ